MYCGAPHVVEIVVFLFVVLQRLSFLQLALCSLVMRTQGKHDNLGGLGVSDIASLA